MNEELKITIKGREYKVSFPTVGQYYNIEALKQTLSMGFYNTLAKSQVKTAINACDMIDIEAYLTVLCPELLSDLKVQSFKDLGIQDYNEIKKVYMKEIIPFLTEIEDLLSNIDAEEKD